jgi:hypothetical protein
MDCKKIAKEMLINTVNTKLLKYTVVFFIEDEKRNEKLHGCGVLVRYKSKHFLLSAAHVMAEYYNNIYVILHNKQLKLGGQLCNSPLPASGKREDDKLDFAIMTLCDTSVNELSSRFSFYNLDSNDINCIVNKPCFLHVGYPGTKTKKDWNKDNISSVPFQYLSEIDSTFDYQKYGFCSQTHIAIKYDGKAKSINTGNINQTPDVHGISGSGLWYLKTLSNPQLAGIIIERPLTKGGYKPVLISIKIEVLIKVLNQYA